MNEGFVKIYRESLDSSVFKNAKYWQLWCYILMSAGYKSRKVPFNGQDIDVPAGAFITGRESLAKNTCQSEQNIRSGLKYLKSTSRISIQVTNRFSIIQVLNWEKYQISNQLIFGASNQQLTNSQPATNQQVTTNKKGKNIKKVKNNDYMNEKAKEKESSSFFKNLSSDFYSIVDEYVDLRSAEGFVKSSKSGYKKKLMDNIEKDSKCFEDVKEYVEKRKKKDVSVVDLSSDKISNGLDEISMSLIEDVFFEVENMDHGKKTSIIKEAEEITKKQFKKNEITKIIKPAVKGNVVDVYQGKIKEQVFNSIVNSDFQCDFKSSELDIKAMKIDFSKANNLPIEEVNKMIDSGRLKPFDNYFSLYYGKKESEEMLKLYYKSILTSMS